MNIVEINGVNRGSTGTIMRAIADKARQRGHNVLVCYPMQRDNFIAYKKGDYLIGNRFIRNLGLMLCRWFNCYSTAHSLSTIALIKRLNEFKPDVIHLHNLHPLYLNLKLLVRYANNHGIRVFITQHDCWLYTGHCPYYSNIQCYQWQSECKDCPVYKEYPESNWDDSKFLFHYKKDILLSINNLTLIPVSKWLGNEDRQSFLRDCNIKPLSNGINLEVFKPTYDDTVVSKYGLDGKYVIMGCATDWGYRKGLEDYIQLSSMLYDDEVILLVGISDNTIKNKPSNIITVNRTESQYELAVLYTRANVLLSLSKEETFGLTIVEAMACGTPAIVYDNTAQPELINGLNGLVAQNGDLNAVRQMICEIKSWNHDVSNECISFALSYDQSIAYDKYIDLITHS